VPTGWLVQYGPEYLVSPHAPPRSTIRRPNSSAENAAGSGKNDKPLNPPNNSLFSLRAPFTAADVASYFRHATAAQRLAQKRQQAQRKQSAGARVGGIMPFPWAPPQSGHGFLGTRVGVRQ
jgi:hypothetical protein